MNKEEILFQNKWVEVRKRDFYVFIHSPWCKGVGVAILPFRTKNPSRGTVEDGTFQASEVEYLGVIETCLAHGDEAKLGPIMGGWDKDGESHEECAVRELEEEGGCVVDASELIPLGQTRPSKSSDSLMYLYAVEITENHQVVEITGDGTVGEEGIVPQWVSRVEGIMSQDPLFATMITRLEIIKNEH